MNSSNRSMPIKASARGFGRVALVVVLVALVVAGWGLVSRERAEARLRAHTEKQIARTVTTISATRSDTSIDLSLPGNVVARVEASIFARTDGYLARLHVDIGTTVTAGQLLAEIDAPELDQQLREGGAEVAAAEAAAALAQTTAERWLA
ncbi:MAG: biotin/lipoyl-binding protein, partial [Pseudomonadales bacterium]